MPRPVVALCGGGAATGRGFTKSSRAFRARSKHLTVRGFFAQSLRLCQPIQPLKPNYMIQRSYDIVIIGSGPAGQKAALNSAKLGRRAALVDRVNSVGGV